MSATLAADVGADGHDRSAPRDDLSQWPGSPVCKQKVWEGHVSKHQEVIIDDEIIRYESIGPEGKWNTFLGCQRGAWGTRAAAHAGGDRVPPLRRRRLHQRLHHRPGVAAVRGDHVAAGPRLQLLRFRHGLLRRQRGRRPPPLPLLQLQRPRRGDAEVHQAAADPHGRRLHPRTLALVHPLRHRSTSTRARTWPTSTPAARSTTGRPARTTSTARCGG